MVRLTLICMFVIFLMAIQHSLVESKSSKKSSKKSSQSSTEKSPNKKLDVFPECGEYEVLSCKLRGCDQETNLVNEIPDEKITASSYYQCGPDCVYYYGPPQSRLNSSLAWVPATQSSDEYLQFEFQDMKIVQAIITLKIHPSHYTTNYNVTTSTDCNTFTSNLPILETGDNSNVTSTFPEPVLAKCVRVHGADWNHYIVVRIGLLGCKA